LAQDTAEGACCSKRRSSEKIFPVMYFSFLNLKYMKLAGVVASDVRIKVDKLVDTINVHIHVITIFVLEALTGRSVSSKAYLQSSQHL
jgi:hypothetical protein